MKKYDYRLEGVFAVDENDTDPYKALNAALCQIPLVETATVHGKGSNVTSLTLTYQRECSAAELEDVEALVAACLSKEGLTMERPAMSHTYVTAPAPKQGRTVSLMAAVGTVITAVILAVLCTFAVMTMTTDRKADMTVTEGTGEKEESKYAILDLLDDLFAQSSPHEIDDQAVIEAVLDAYVAATGDRYAEYYTPDEYKDLTADQNGEMCGVGIQVINGHVTVDGQDLQAILVSYVYADSPAEAAGVLPGDAIITVGKGENARSVNEVGYTMALDLLAGEEGTLCEFAVYRTSVDGDHEEIEFSIERKKLTVLSVTYSVCSTDDTVGIIRLTEFDNTTAPQLTAAVDDLKAQGCTYFVFDLRGNPGGLLTSVVDVLTFFLNEGDVVLTAKDKYDRVETVTVGSPDKSGKLNSGSGTLTAEDIGKYRDLDFAVLVNEYSASAAELFTANIRDYELGQIVGVTTYGKGSMQSTFPLSYYGYEGALKLTTKFYFPPCGEGYDGLGILPHAVVEMSEEAKQYNINILPHDKDNQLQEAIRLIKQ